MHRLSIVALSAAILLAVPGTGTAQEDGSLGVSLFTGTQNTPTAFDAFRDVEYDPGVRLGVGLEVGIDEYVSVRGMFSMADNGGRETGVLDESIDFSRRYYGAELQVKYPLGNALTPYVTGGGGLVTLTRSSPSYSYDMTEGAGILGLGASYRLGRSLSVFAEGKGWIYSRHTIGELQVDKMFNVGVSYRMPL